MISFLDFLSEEWHVVNIKKKSIDSSHAGQGPARRRAQELNTDTYNKYGENHYFVTADHGYEGMSAKELPPSKKEVAHKAKVASAVAASKPAEPKAKAAPKAKKTNYWGLIKKNLR
jgi:hypothetical protein